MIRLIVGLILLFGGAGALELNAAVAPALVMATLGLGFMTWSVVVPSWDKDTPANKGAV